MLTFNDFPIPDINIIDEILEMDFLEFAYELKETDSISKYSDYPVTPVNLIIEFQIHSIGYLQAMNTKGKRKTTRLS